MKATRQGSRPTLEDPADLRDDARRYGAAAAAAARSAGDGSPLSLALAIRDARDFARLAARAALTLAAVR